MSQLLSASDHVPLAFISRKRAHRNSTGTTGTNYCCLTQNLLERSPQHVLSFRIAVKVGTINPSLVKSVSRLVFLSFTDLSVTRADAATHDEMNAPNSSIREKKADYTHSSQDKHRETATCTNCTNTSSGQKCWYELTDLFLEVLATFGQFALLIFELCFDNQACIKMMQSYAKHVLMNNFLFVKLL